MASAMTSQLGTPAAGAWKSSGIFDEVLKTYQPPAHITGMVYQGKYKVELGNKLTPEQTQTAPSITYPADPDHLYTVLFFDPDAPSREDPKMAPWCHWAVANVHGDQVQKGEALVPYQGPAPPPGTGYHRYIVTVWQQHEHLDDATQKLKHLGTTSSHRAHFNFQQWLNQYKTTPTFVSGNFFLSQNAKNEQKD